MERNEGRDGTVCNFLLQPPTQKSFHLYCKKVKCVEFHVYQGDMFEYKLKLEEKYKKKTEKTLLIN